MKANEKSFQKRLSTGEGMVLKNFRKFIIFCLVFLTFFSVSNSVFPSTANNSYIGIKVNADINQEETSPTSTPISMDSPTTTPVESAATVTDVPSTKTPDSTATFETSTPTLTNNPELPTITTTIPVMTPTSTLTNTAEPVMSQSSGISFFDNWEQGITGPGRWSHIQVVANDRFQRVSSPGQISPYAARVEVRPGDDPINSSGERAEALIMSDANGNPINENESSGTQYIAFSIQLPSDWVRPVHYGICLQLHGPDALAASPAMAIEATDAFYLDVTAGHLDTPATMYSHAYIPMSDSSLNLGHWVYFVLKIKFAKDFTGSIDVWRANEGTTQFTKVLSIQNIPTLQYKSSLGGVGDHYWKYGYYRADQTTVTSILFLGAIARGTTFDDVVAATFPLHQGQTATVTGIPFTPDPSFTVTPRPSPPTPTKTPVTPTVTPTKTNTPVPTSATRTKTSTPVTPTATRTNTLLLPTATKTKTAVPPSATATPTSIPLPPPNLLAPSNNGTALTTRPIFQWNAVSGATGYTFQLSTSAAFSSLTANINVSTSSYSVTSDLARIKTYFWRVKANGNKSSTWSRVFSFTSANPPAIPPLASPANGDLLTNYQPRLDWHGVKAANYQVQLANSNSFSASSLVLNVYVNSGTHFDLLALLPANSNYYWHVRAFNESGQYSLWSPYHSFKTAMLPPTLLDPFNNSSPLTTRPTFDWGRVSGATGYKIQISKSSTFSSKIIDKTIANPFYTPTNDLPRNTLLYWRTSATGSRPSAWSQAFSFTSAVPPPLSALVSPSDNSSLSNYTTTFNWNDPTNTDYYQVQLASSKSFSGSSMVYDIVTTSSDFTPPLPLSPNRTFF